MRTGFIVVALTVVATFGVTALAAEVEQITVVQLDSQHFSTQELGRLSAELARLDDLLSAATLGPQRRLGQDGWTWQSFAEFSAGSLAERGYEVVLALDGQRTWILVSLLIDGRTIWIPVEPSPAGTAPQTTLGRIPFARPGTGSLLLEGAYLSFTSTSALQPNLGPTAVFRVSDRVVERNASVRLEAAASWDPDGVIALYRWCIDGAPCVATLSWSFIARSGTPGENRITLFVVDNAGRSASSEAFFSVRSDDPEPTRSPLYDPADCGCGG